MTDDDQDVLFSNVLAQILSEEQVPIHLLFRLSDMSPEEAAEFERVWREGDDERRREIVRHLVDLSEDDFVVDFQPVFVRCLADPYAPVRVGGLDGLWDTTDLQLIEPIISLMNDDPSAEVQAAAAGTLAHYLLMAAWGQLKRVPENRIYEALMARHNDRTADLRVRRVALEALGSLNSPEVGQAIEAAYEGPIRELQLGALFAMGNSADPRWLPILLDEMESPYEDMRLEAARAAGNIGHSEALAGLADLAYDEDEEVAITAINAIAEIGGDAAQDVLTALIEDEDLEHLEDILDEALEETSFGPLDMGLSLLIDDAFDEEE